MSKRAFPRPPIEPIPDSTLDNLIEALTALPPSSNMDICVVSALRELQERRRKDGGKA